MRVIITGGTGYIGSILAKDLVSDGHEVIVLSRDPDQRRDELPHPIQLVGWDAESTAGWGHLADGAGAIVNLAGENLAGKGFFPYRWTSERKRRIRESRMNVGKAVTEAVEAVDSKPAVVIQASAVGYYGPSGDTVITASSSPGDDFLARVCVEWEASTEGVEAMGVRRAIIRTGGIILSAEEGALPRLVFPFRLFSGSYFGSGEQWYSWIHPQDEVNAIRFLIRHEEASGPFNLAAPNPQTARDFCRAIGQVLNRPCWLPVPGFAMKLAFGEVAEVVLEGQRAVPERLQELGYDFQFPDLEPALRDILR